MSMLAELQRWLRANPPSAMPFYPGAHCTGRLALRDDRDVIQAGASPMHLGVDRTGGGRLVMPFDGRVSWRKTGGVAGTVLHLTPDGIPMEIQVFHTQCLNRHVDEYGTIARAGEVLDVIASDLGFALGTHTHTEVLFAYDPELLAWLVHDVPQVVTNGVPDEEFIVGHCETHDLHTERFLGDVRQQIDTWAIRDFWPRAAVRRALPSYREAPWIGKTIHVDSLWLLQI